MSDSPPLTKRFDAALKLAAELHRAQRRKGSNTPYIGHLLGVCSLVLEDGGDEDEAIAALLHDAVEDQGGEQTLARIREQFGERVARIVLACSDATEIPKPPWRQRKEAYLAHLADQEPDVLRVSLADKLYNARAILGDYLEYGDEVWRRFRAGREAQLWYYRSLADVLSRAQPGRLAAELSETVAQLERSLAAEF
jgi:(p)ppGpp synthase/HD superfamily hydrolase